MIAVLHNIRSMHNVGSILRTADAAGVEKVYMCGITPTPKDEFGKWRTQITKTSLGAEYSVEWEKCGSASSPQAAGTTALLDRLKKEGYKIYAIEQHKNSVVYNKLNVKKSGLDKTVLVLGHELKGLSEAVLKRADKIIEIPMRGKKNSLNVAVAFGVVVYGIQYE